MRREPLPAGASWRHQGARRGFEVAFFAHETDGGFRLSGSTSANESSALWAVDYEVTVDAAWRTVAVRAMTRTEAGRRSVAIDRDADGRWRVDGLLRADLDGCVDIDFESSAVTNTLPVHRIDFTESVGVDVPAAFVRAEDLRVERLEQRYTLIEAVEERAIFHYESSTFDFACDLEYDAAGLVLAYPGIAVRDS